jgi:hypothetical protein
MIRGKFGDSETEQPLGGALKFEVVAPVRVHVLNAYL